MQDRIITVRVERVTPLTPEVNAYEFVHPLGRPLPDYKAGAHIDVHLPGGFMRQYSLAHAPAPEAQTRYRIGVKREPESRGGSVSMHDRVHAGDLLAIGTPRNNFPVHRDAAHHLLLAGGIGITPLLAMAQQLAQDGARFTLCAFARDRLHLPFADSLAALAPNVRVHLDDGPPGDRLDIRRLVADAADQTHLYVCGPAGFMRAVLDAAHDWPDDRVHLEYFAPPDTEALAGADEPFTLHLARRGITVDVGADQSAIDALHDLGIDVPTSCEQGMCGTCVVPWIATGGGEPEHRDHCLSPTERRSKVALCCARGKAGPLTVDM